MRLIGGEMTLSELLKAYGDDKLKAQPLDSCIINLRLKKPGVTEITFGTEETFDLNGTTTHLGIVVWLDRDRAKEILVRSK